MEMKSRNGSWASNHRMHSVLGFVAARREVGRRERREGREELEQIQDKRLTSCNPGRWITTTMVVWGAYLRSLSSRPLLTKSLSSGVLFGVGDVLAQSISHDKVDGGRACWLTVFGCAVYGPSNHAWFALQERYVNVGGSRKLLQACARVGVHSVVYAPLSVAAFVGWVAFKEDIRGAWGRVEENTFKLWLAGTSFWVPTSE
eukprot:585018-Hanusia_phi.AAC.1